MDLNTAIKELIAEQVKELVAQEVERQLKAQLATRQQTGKIAELAQELGVSSRSLYALMKDNPIPGDARRKVGGRYVYDFEKMRGWFWACGEW